MMDLDEHDLRQCCRHLYEVFADHACATEAA